MLRLIIAIAGMLGLTLSPLAYRLSLQQREPADFVALSEKLDAVTICPPGWQVTEGTFNFEGDWEQRLDLHHHRSAEITTDDGRKLSVLVMLSETGEQLYHTPDVCYAAHGCEVRGNVESLSLGQPDDSNIRVVNVAFPEVLGETIRTAAYGYWVDSQWCSPPQASILNQMGREPFLLKVQVLLDDAVTDDAEAKADLERYLAFLGDQLKQQEI